MSIPRYTCKGRTLSTGESRKKEALRKIILRGKLLKTVHKITSLILGQDGQHQEEDGKTFQ